MKKKTNLLLFVLCIFLLLGKSGFAAEEQKADAKTEAKAAGAAALPWSRWHRLCTAKQNP